MQNLKHTTHIAYTILTAIAAAVARLKAAHGIVFVSIITKHET